MNKEKANVKQDIPKTGVTVDEDRGVTKEDISSKTTSEAGGRVDQIRDILFGAQREEYDRRFGRLEELLVKNISDLSNDTAKKFSVQRDEYDKRLTRLEELLVKNISDLSNDTTEKLSAQRDEYDKRLMRLEELLVKNISDLSSDTAEKFNAYRNDTAEKFSAQRDEYDQRLMRLEELLVKSISDLSNDTTGKFDSILKQLNAEQESRIQSDKKLDTNKVNRDTITKLLAKMIKVAGEFGISKQEGKSN